MEDSKMRLIKLCQRQKNKIAKMQESTNEMVEVLTFIHNNTNKFSFDEGYVLIRKKRYEQIWELITKHENAKSHQDKGDLK